MGKFLDMTFYNPAQLKDEDFLRGFVARRELAEKLLTRLKEIKPRDIAKHRLIIGQRGMGKTSLLRRIALGVRESAELSAVLLPLTFREEQYNVHNLHVFWCNCLDALGDWFDASGQHDKAERIDHDVAALQDAADDDEGSQTLGIFRKWMKQEGKRALLLLDNVDLIFDGLKNKQWSLRRILQEASGIVVIGATANFLEAAVKPDAPFYDFFQVDVLEKLSREELLSSLRQLALERGDAGKNVLRVLDREPARIHVLYDLTGGNPRTLAMLYLMLEVGDDCDLMRDLERLLDLATPLYKARIEEFAPQARVVFDAVALNWNPVIAADLVAATGLEIGAVSTQLDRLHKNGILEKTSLASTVRTGFQLGERFFNIWYLMRHAPRRQRNRLRWLTEFLCNFYTPPQLIEVASDLIKRPGSDHLTRSAYCLALSDAMKDEEMRAVLRAVSAQELEHHAADAGISLESLIDDPDLKSPQNAYEWLRHGYVLKEKFAAYEQAEAAYRKSIEMDPENAFTWILLGDLLANNLGRYEEAEAAYRKAIEADPRDAFAWTRLGNLLTDKFGRYEEAEAAYRKAIEVEPRDATAWTWLGLLLSDNLGRYEEAEAAYRKVIEVDPQDAFAWTRLGNLLTDKFGRYEEAEAAYRKVIEVDPQDAFAWTRLGNLLTDKFGRYEEAEAAYRKAIEVDPRYAMAWTWLGGLLADNLGSYEEAEAAYRKAIEVDSQYAFAWTRLGLLLADNLGRYEEAEAAYRKGIEVDPQDAFSRTLLGDFLADKLDRYEEAEAAYRKAIEVDPRDAYAWTCLGDLLANNLGRYEEAEVAYRKAIEVDSQYAFAWTDLGDLLADNLGRYEEAEAAYRKAIEIDPQNADAWTRLGTLLADYLGRDLDAEHAYRQAMKIEPEDIIPVAELAYLVLDRRGGREEAEACYQRAIAALPAPDAGLLKTYYALAHDDFGAGVTELQRVMDTEKKDLLSSCKDELLRVLRLAARHGYGEKLLSWLDESGLEAHYWPLSVAFDAYLHGEEKLKDVNPEVRTVAARIFSQLAQARRI